MKRAKQLGFIILEEKKNLKAFGGSLLKGNPKEKRPIATKKSMHLVMRSSLAKGTRSFLKFDRQIQAIIGAQASRFGIKIYRQANGGNHLHLTVLTRSRAAFNGFIRSVTGLIARLVLGAERNSAQNTQFWDKRPFTRIIEWGREFQIVSKYLVQNTLEALGFIPYSPRKTRYGPPSTA